VADAILPFEIGNAIVSLDADEQGNLAAVKLELRGVTIEYTDNGRIDPSPAHLQNEAFRVASYLANRIFLQTSVDAFDPDDVLMGAPLVFPENLQEQDEFARTPRAMWKRVLVGFSVRGELDPAGFAVGFVHSTAYGHYAEAKRISNPFQKFELFFKVIECFFSEKGEALDRAVSGHGATCDTSFPPDAVERLRHLRNRVVHPQARLGHARPERPEDLIEVTIALSHLDNLATFLINNPKL
jgi:hypothetical protein